MHYKERTKQAYKFVLFPWERATKIESIFSAIDRIKFTCIYRKLLANLMVRYNILSYTNFEIKENYKTRKKR